MWIKFDDGTQAAIDAVIASSAEVLRSAGFKLSRSRFPFALHHDYYRVRLRREGRKLSHAEVALLLNRWASERNDRADYARQAVCGAVLSIVGSRKELGNGLPTAIGEVAECVGGGSSFLEWARAYLASPDNALAPPGRAADGDMLLEQLL